MWSRLRWSLRGEEKGGNNGRRPRGVRSRSGGECVRGDAALLQKMLHRGERWEASWRYGRSDRNWGLENDVK